jgi:hypothetical protein
MVGVLFANNTMFNSFSKIFPIHFEGTGSVRNDKEGHSFPWVPKTFHQLIGTSFTGKDGKVVPYESIKEKYLGLYFSASW